MRTLYLLRHAKSSWDDPTLADHDRPLAARGIRATSAVADHLRHARVFPDVVLCSAARRTRETLDLLGDAIPATSDVHVEDRLHGAPVEVLLDRLRALPTARTERRPRRVLLDAPGQQRLDAGSQTATRLGVLGRVGPRSPRGQHADRPDPANGLNRSRPAAAS